MIYLLSPDPPLVEGVFHLPGIEIEYLSPKVELEGVDLLLFTSKNGVRGLDRLGVQWHQIPAVVVGEGTKREVERFGGKVVGVGKGYGVTLIQLLAQFPRSTLLFCRGEVLATELAPFLANLGHRVKEVILYRTRCSEKLPPVVEGIPIFTSPFTVRCLFRKSRVVGEVAVAIGRRTEKELKKFWKGEILIPATPSIEGAIGIAKGWLERKGGKNGTAEEKGR
ncbi:MAG: uroporphyrinogen-III synthase [Campylobacterales bacterium]